MQLSRFSFLSTQSTFSLSSARVHYTTEKLISFTSALALWMRTHQSSVQGFEYIIVHIESKILNVEYYFSFQKLRVNVLDPVNLNINFRIIQVQNQDKIEMSLALRKWQWWLMLKVRFFIVDCKLHTALRRHGWPSQNAKGREGHCEHYLEICRGKPNEKFPTCSMLLVSAPSLHSSSIQFFVRY